MTHAKAPVMPGRLLTGPDISAPARAGKSLRTAVDMMLLAEAADIRENRCGSFLRRRNHRPSQGNRLKVIEWFW